MRQAFDRPALGGRFWELLCEHRDHLIPLLLHRRLVLLNEHRAPGASHHVLAALGHLDQQIAGKVNAAPLPAAALAAAGDRLLEAAAAQRKGSALSVRAEWRQGVEAVLEAGLLWQQERLQHQEQRRLIQHEQNQQQLLIQNRHLQEQHSDEWQQQGSTAQSPFNSPPSTPGKPSPFAAPRSGSRKRGADADYFESLAAGEQGEQSGD